MKKDIGTYHLKVEFEDGRGYIQQFPTGIRFTHGRHNCHPLTAQPITPTWEDEDDLIGTILWMYLDGNYACDCNRKLFLADAAQSESENDECGHEIKLKQLTLIRPDGAQRKIWPDS